METLVDFYLDYDNRYQLHNITVYRTVSNTALDEDVWELSEWIIKGKHFNQN